MCIYIYIGLSLSIYIYIYIHTHIHTYTHIAKSHASLPRRTRQRLLRPIRGVTKSGNSGLDPKQILISEG